MIPWLPLPKLYVIPSKTVNGAWLLTRTPEKRCDRIGTPPTLGLDISVGRSPA